MTTFPRTQWTEFGKDVLSHADDSHIGFLNYGGRAVTIKRKINTFIKKIGFKKTAKSQIWCRDARPYISQQEPDIDGEGRDKQTSCHDFPCLEDLGRAWLGLWSLSWFLFVWFGFSPRFVRRRMRKSKKVKERIFKVQLLGTENKLLS